MSKPVFYTFGLSVWAAAPELALLELGYTDKDVEKKVINLVNGENFAPAFVKINPNATLPTLTAGGKAYTNTTEVVDYLVKHAPIKVAPRTEVCTIVHEDKYDPNFPLLLARNEEELQAKAGGFPLTFLKNRQEALGKHAASGPGADHKDFYDAKLAGNGGVLAIYQGKSPEGIKAGFFEQSNRHWELLREYILEVLPGSLPDSGFFGGRIPGEDDFHVGAWLARIASTVGASQGRDGIKDLEKELGKPVPAKVVDYWNEWAARPSWKTVYADGCH